jgi:hypothetical protein
MLIAAFFVRAANVSIHVHHRLQLKNKKELPMHVATRVTLQRTTLIENKNQWLHTV